MNDISRRFNPEFDPAPGRAIGKPVNLLAEIGADDRASAESENRRSILIEQQCFPAQVKAKRQLPFRPLGRNVRPEPEPARFPGSAPGFALDNRTINPFGASRKRNRFDGTEHLRLQRDVLFHKMT